MSEASELIPIVVVGAHLSGLPLNHQLTGSGGRLIRKRHTAADYRLFALPNTVPPKPGLVRDPGFAGPGLEVEVWELPAAAFGRFVSQIPAPLGIGKVTLDDGSAVSGFLCEAHAVAGATEITKFGGWRAFLAARSGWTLEKGLALVETPYRGGPDRSHSSDLPPPSKRPRKQVRPSDDERARRNRQNRAPPPASRARPKSGRSQVTDFAARAGPKCSIGS